MSPVTQQAWVGVTDYDWYRFLRAMPGIDEVNFWRPGGKTNFKALRPGEPFLFKLHSPRNVIAGGGFFAHFSIVPASFAWEAFEQKNGAPTYGTMRAQIEKYRRSGPRADYNIGCILLEEPFFFSEEEWIPIPDDWRANVVQGRRYDLSRSPGRELWDDVQDRLTAPGRHRRHTDWAAVAAPPSPKYGELSALRPRLGQGSFRLMVTDAYGRRCAATGERTLPVLEAAHIRPYGGEGEHRLDNGLLLRSDLHKLFDRGYVTVTPEFRFEVVGGSGKSSRMGETTTRCTAAVFPFRRSRRIALALRSLNGTPRTSSSADDQSEIDTPTCAFATHNAVFGGSMNPRAGRSGVIVFAFALLLAWSFPYSSSAQAQQPGGARAKRDSTSRLEPTFPAGMMEQQAAMMGPMMSAMTQAIFDAKLARLAKPETAAQLASFVKNFYAALLDQGFTKEEALRLVAAIGIPGLNGGQPGS